LLRFSPDGDTLMAWSYPAMRLWQTSTGKPRPTPQTPPNVVFGMPVFSPNGRALVLPDLDGHLLVFDVVTGKEERGTKLPGAALGLAFAADGRYLATANANGTFYILRTSAQGAGGDHAWKKLPAPEVAPDVPIKPVPVERLKERLEELKRTTPELPPKE
jgi:WD40 repeat protein